MVPVNVAIMLILIATLKPIKQKVNELLLKFFEN